MMLFDSDTARGLVMLDFQADDQRRDKNDTKTRRSALFSMTQAIDALTDGVPQTEPAEQPIVRMTTVVVHSPAVAAIIFAALSGLGAV